MNEGANSLNAVLNQKLSTLRAELQLLREQREKMGGGFAKLAVTRQEIKKEWEKIKYHYLKVKRGCKKRVLIVDDEPTIRSSFNLVFKKIYQVFTAVNGQDGLFQFKLHAPDIIITDLNMPVLSGVKMINQIRASDNKVKIIGYSSFDNEWSRNLMLKAGANRCLSKPASFNCIEALIEELLTGL
jgi:CheY-like chemotaxis protein